MLKRNPDNLSVMKLRLPLLPVELQPQLMHQFYIFRR